MTLSTRVILTFKSSHFRMTKIFENNRFKMMSNVKSHTNKYEIDLFSVHILIYLQICIVSE